MNEVLKLIRERKEKLDRGEDFNDGAKIAVVVEGGGIKGGYPGGDGGGSGGAGLD